MERFFDWTDRIRPEWVKVVVFMSGTISAALLVASSLAYVLNAMWFPPVWWLLPAVSLSVLSVVVYAWYIAIFKQ